MKKYSLSKSTVSIFVGVLGAIGSTMIPLNSVQAADTRVVAFPFAEPNPTSPTSYWGDKTAIYDRQLAEKVAQHGAMGPLRDDMASKVYFPGESPNPTEYLGSADTPLGAMGPIRSEDISSTRSFPGESMNPTEYQ